MKFRSTGCVLVTAVLRGRFEGANHLCALGNVKPVLSHVEEHQARGPRGGELSLPQALRRILPMILVAHETSRASTHQLARARGWCIRLVKIVVTTLALARIAANVAKLPAFIEADNYRKGKLE